MCSHMELSSFVERQIGSLSIRGRPISGPSARWWLKSQEDELNLIFRGKRRESGSVWAWRPREQLCLTGMKGWLPGQDCRS